jgi:hypothetical protein
MSPGFNDDSINRRAKPDLEAYGLPRSQVQKAVVTSSAGASAMMDAGGLLMALLYPARGWCAEFGVELS